MEAAAAAESLRCRKAEEEGEGRGHRGRCPCALDSGWSYFFRDNFFLVNEGNFWYHVKIRSKLNEGRSVANLMKTGKREIFNNSSQAPDRERENGERENGERESWRELKQSKLKIYE